MDTSPVNGRSRRGFASISAERQREIAQRGGKAAHEKGTAHEFNSIEASMAARKGHERGTAHEFTRDEARLAGRKGGLARAKNRRINGNNGATAETHEETVQMIGSSAI
jgi:general stress protein YciG